MLAKSFQLYLESSWWLLYVDITVFHLANALQKLLEQSENKKPKQRVALKNDMWSVKPLSDGQVRGESSLHGLFFAILHVYMAYVFSDRVLCFLFQDMPKK